MHSVVSSNLFAEEKKKDLSKLAQELMLKYLKSIKNKDEKTLKSIITKRYYKDINVDDGIKQLFTMQSDDKERIEVDIKVVKQNVGYRANIKNKTDKDYDDYWYKITEEDGKLLIDGTFHQEE